MDLTDTNGDGVADQWTDTDGDGQPDGIIQETINGCSYNYYFMRHFDGYTARSGAFPLDGRGATAAEAESALKSLQSTSEQRLDILYGHGEIRIQDAIDAYNEAAGPQGIDLGGDLIISEVIQSRNGDRLSRGVD